MSETKPVDDGGRAFPCGGVSYGMTLRDYFIAAAIPDAMREATAGIIVVLPGEQPQDAVARVALAVANAALRAREGK